MAVGRASSKPVPPTSRTQPGEGKRGPAAAGGAAGGAAAGLDPRQQRLEQTRQTLDAKLKSDQVTTQRPRTASSDKLQAFAEASITSGEHLAPTTPTPPRVARGLGASVSAEASAGGQSDTRSGVTDMLKDPGTLVRGAVLTGWEETDQRRQREPELTPGDARREQQLQNEIADRDRRTQNDEIVQQIDGLQVGEKITDSTRMGGKVQVPGVKIAEAGVEGGESTTVERTGESEYKVTQSGELGGKVGVGVDVKSVELGGDTSLTGERKDEHLFKNAADAKRGADILRNGPRNADDSKFLEDHLASTEFGAKVGSSGSATFPTSGKVVLGTNVEARGEAATSVKYNYKRNEDGTVARDASGKPIVDSMEFITRTTGTFTGKGTVGVPPAVSVDTGDLTSGQIEIEQKTVVKVPPDVNPDDVARDPSLGQKVNQNAAETTVKVTGESRTAGTTEGESRIREYETKIRTVQADGEPRKPTVETTSRVYEKRGHVYTGGVDLGPVGGTYSHETSKTGKPAESKIDTLSSS